MTALREAIDTTTLGWIKPELDETLRQARQEIEAFAEDPADTARMRVCANHLHQVHGTLRMVELYAPAMVAEEMERLALALQQGSVADRDEACAALMRGVVLLPDYLERLQGGHRDIPIVLLPLLNELRATRGESGLNESVLFAPNLDRPLPAHLPPPLPVGSGGGRNASAPHLAALRDALTAWPEDGVPSNPAQLASAIDGLLADVVLEPVRRMLWVASSVSHAVRDGALPATRSLRQAFGGVEREARQILSDDGFSTPRGEPAAEPTRQLLYHVAHSDGRHPALDDLRQTFELAAHLPSESELEHARGSLSGRNRALLDTVAAAIKEDLLRVKDALDLHLRTNQTDAGELRPQVEALARVSDTLGMMGLGMARTVVLQQRDAMSDIVDGRRAADEGTLLDVAGALLYVDASLDDQVSRLGLPDDKAEEDLLAGEARKVLDVVAREAIANFGDARQSFVAFVETKWDHDELAEVPRVLDEVAGALRMIELPLAADYLTGVKRYTEVELIGRRRVPSGQQLDTLADALASLEYYLEALREQRPNRDDILDIARQSLEVLRYWPLPDVIRVEPQAEVAAPPVVAAEVAPPAVAETAPPPSASETVASESHTQIPVAPDWSVSEAQAHDASASTGSVESGQVDAEHGAAQYTSAFEPDASHAAPAEPADIAERVSGGLVNTAMLEALPSSPPSFLGASSPAQGGFETVDDIDDEVREIFLEEFQEEIGNLEHLLPAWRDAPDDLARVQPVRRVFHTLKGSGRLVGARTLGEFSWKVENLLNRVREHGRPASPEVIDLVEHAHRALPGFYAALRNEAPLSVDVAGIEAHADRLANGEEAYYQAPVAAIAGEPEIVDTAPAIVSDGPYVPASVDRRHRADRSLRQAPARQRRAGQRRRHVRAQRGRRRDPPHGRSAQVADPARADVRRPARTHRDAARQPARRAFADDRRRVRSRPRRLAGRAVAVGTHRRRPERVRRLRLVAGKHRQDRNGRCRRSPVTELRRRIRNQPRRIAGRIRPEHRRPDGPERRLDRAGSPRRRARSRGAGGSRASDGRASASRASRSRTPRSRTRRSGPHRSRAHRSRTYRGRAGRNVSPPSKPKPRAWKPNVSLRSRPKQSASPPSRPKPRVLKPNASPRNRPKPSVSKPSGLRPSRRKPRVWKPNASPPSRPKRRAWKPSVLQPNRPKPSV
ncbi:MAG: Hpt domain-containing protein [Lysobacter sp.]|nr:Hpt domain-containing protein [Lysobacter sp.]